MAGFVKYLLPLLLASVVQAQELPDPTRPAQDSGSRLPRDASGVATDADGLRLETVFRARGRQFAIINGQRYQLGQTVNGAKLVQINEQEVVLQRGVQRQHLALYPGISKLPANPPASRK